MSDTSKTKTKRRRKQTAQGKDRKRKLEKEGTTPSFPLDPNAAKPQPSADS